MQILLLSRKDKTTSLYIIYNQGAEFCGRIYTLLRYNHLGSFGSIHVTSTIYVGIYISVMNHGLSDMIHCQGRTNIEN